MRRRHTRRENLVSAMIGCVIGLALGLAHVQSVKNYQASELSQFDRQQDVILLENITPVLETAAPEEPTTWEPEPYNDPDIPDEVEAAAEAAGEAYGIEPEFLEAVAFYESTYNTQAINGGCYGLMQISTYWHMDRIQRLGYTESSVWEAGPSMMIAADYLEELFEKYDDPYWVLMTYNGDSAADVYRNGNGSPSEYALLVTELAFELRNRHGKL